MKLPIGGRHMTFPTCLLPPLPIIPGVAVRHIPGWFGYAATDGGVILSAYRRGRSGDRNGGIGQSWHSLRPGPKNKKGYAQVSLRAYPPGGRRSVSVHRLVLEAFVGPRPAGMECRHHNGKPSDNRLCNLSWGTPLENLEDKRAHGTLARTA